MLDLNQEEGVSDLQVEVKDSHSPFKNRSYNSLEQTMKKLFKPRLSFSIFFFSIRWKSGERGDSVHWKTLSTWCMVFERWNKSILLLTTKKTLKLMWFYLIWPVKMAFPSNHRGASLYLLLGFLMRKELVKLVFFCKLA